MGRLFIGLHTHRRRLVNTSFDASINISIRRKKSHWGGLFADLGCSSGFSNENHEDSKAEYRIFHGRTVRVGQLKMPKDPEIITVKATISSS